MKKILLTGGSGFIGHNILEQLGTVYEISAPGHAELDLLNDDQVQQYLKSGRFDAVIHSAVKPGHRNASDLSGLVEANTRMFFNLARCRSLFGSMLFLGSGSVYDTRQNLSSVPEEAFDMHVPADPVGYAKYLCSTFIQTTDNIFDLRIFGIFGKYEDYAIRFISNAICKTLFDLPITCRQNRTFSYLFIDDLMPVLKFFIETPPPERAYNITPEETVELAGIARTVAALSGTNVPVQIAQSGNGLSYSGDNARLRKDMPGVTMTPIDQAIRKLYDWYRAHQSSLDRSKLLVDK